MATSVSKKTDKGLVQVNYRITKKHFNKIEKIKKETGRSKNNIIAIAIDGLEIAKGA